MTEDEVKILQVQLKMAGKKWLTCRLLSKYESCKGEVRCYYEKDNYWGEERYHFLCGQHDHLAGSLKEVTTIQCE